jgi:hypothetical protein
MPGGTAQRRHNGDQTAAGQRAFGEAETKDPVRHRIKTNLAPYTQKQHQQYHPQTNTPHCRNTKGGTMPKTELTKTENTEKELLLVAQALIHCWLPYKPLYDESGKPQRTYSRIAKLTNGTMTLKISGLNPDVLLPYGKDRLLLTWLQTKAIQQSSPTITGESATEFFEAFELKQTGYHCNRLEKTFERLFNTILVLKQETTDSHGKTTIEEEHMPLLAQYEPTKNHHPMEFPFNRSVTLADNLYRHLRNSPVPLNLYVMRAFQNEPKAWDMAAYINYRSFLCRFLANNGQDSTANISLETLRNQMGSHDANPKQLRTTIQKTLNKIKAVWPECQAELLNGGTMVIKPPLENAHLVKQKPKTLYDT